MRYDPLARKLPFLVVLLVFVGGGTLSAIGTPSNGAGFVALLLAGIAGLPWSILVLLFAPDAISNGLAFFLVWLCIALNAALLAYFGWKKPKEPTTTKASP